MTAKADWFHLDIMDGRFVPNISFGPMIVKFIRKTTKKVLRRTPDDCGGLTCISNLLKMQEPTGFIHSYRSLPESAGRPRTRSDRWAWIRALPSVRHAHRLAGACAGPYPWSV